MEDLYLMLIQELDYSFDGILSAKLSSYSRGNEFNFKGILTRRSIETVAQLLKPGFHTVVRLRIPDLDQAIKKVPLFAILTRNISPNFFT